MKLLIVDDEHYIVNYLAALILEHAGEDLEVYKCYSGIEAMDLAKTMKIDLALLDIHMPGLSGIDTASGIAGYYPDCRFIFLTAFDNFEHIYAADKLDHSRYLLKTESDEVILDEVFSAIREIQSEAAKLHLLSTASQKSMLLSHLLQQTILKEIFSGGSIDKIIQSLQISFSEFPLDLNSPVFLMYTQIHHRTFQEKYRIHSRTTLEYLQLMDRLCVNKFHYSMLDLEQGTLLWLFQPSFDPSLASEFDLLESLANDFSDYCTDTLHRHVTVVLYPAASDWENIYKNFYTLQQYADSFITKAPLIYSSVNILDDEPSSLFLHSGDYIERTEIDRLLQELTFSLYQGSETDYAAVLKKLEEECTTIRSMHDIRAIKIYMSIALLLLNYIDLYQLQEHLASKIALYQLYYIYDFSSWKEAFHYIGSLSHHLFEIQDSKKTDKNNLLIQKIKLYIGQHLSETINLATISRVVNYNETYISRLFKQLTGISLSEYVSQERIKKAKQLLSSTSESIQNIAAVTGFDTSQYFSIVFKKMTGVSPSTYRKTHLYTRGDRCPRAVYIGKRGKSMNRLFNMDNIVMQTLGKLFDLVVLNIVFIISCIPVFTIGTSISSLYTVTLKIVRKKEPYIIKGFFEAFRSNFRQSTILWIFCLIMICFLGYDYRILNAQGSDFSILRILLILITLILCAIFLYLFPVVSYFNSPTTKALQNALLLSIAHLPWTLLLFLYYGTILYLLLHFPQILGLFTLIGMFCGFSLSALLT